MTKDFEQMQILNEAGELADNLWNEIIKWPDFARDTVGKQLVRSVDSIAANVAEAYGRYHYGEKIQFLYYARGSLFESKNWINRCVNRSLLTENKHKDCADSLTNIAKQLNGFVRHLQQRKKYKRAQTIREPSVTYETQDPSPPTLFSNKELKWLANYESQDEL